MGGFQENPFSRIFLKKENERSEKRTCHCYDNLILQQVLTFAIGPLCFSTERNFSLTNIQTTKAIPLSGLSRLFFTDVHNHVTPAPVKSNL
ncbi:MAG: hypothetical protein ACI92E_001389 [Oceanicoccus sp.]|jgi:hypothetical protein